MIIITIKGNYHLNNETACHTPVRMQTAAASTAAHPVTQAAWPAGWQNWVGALAVRMRMMTCRSGLVLLSL
jgi:hypothetical protein